LGGAAQLLSLGIVRMFSFLKRQPTPLTALEYEADFRRYKHELLTQGDSAQARVFFAVSLINTDIKVNHGLSWHELYDEKDLDTLREHLVTESSFSSEQLEKIRQSLDEITAFGRDVPQHGKPNRKVAEATDYLVMRVIDWLRLHPKKNDVA
jgi:hypothetical protein